MRKSTPGGEESMVPSSCQSNIDKLDFPLVSVQHAATNDSMSWEEKLIVGRFGAARILMIVVCKIARVMFRHILLLLCGGIAPRRSKRTPRSQSGDTLTGCQTPLAAIYRREAWDVQQSGCLQHDHGI